MNEMTSAPVPAVPTRSEERALAGRISGIGFLLAAVTLALLTVLPGVTHAHRGALLGLAGAVAVVGLCELFLIDWHRASWSLLHVSTVISLVAVAVAVADTGGARSPAWVYLFIVVILAGYLYRPWVAALYVAGAVAANALPLFYDSRATHDLFLSQFVIAVPAYLILGGSTLAVKLLLRRMRFQAEELAAEQSALKRVATAVVGGGSPEEFYELVAYEAGWLLGAGAAGILRLESPTETLVMGSWSDHPGGRYPSGTSVPIRPGSDIDVAVEARRAVRIDDHEPDSAVSRLGYRCSIVTPVLVADQVWGVLAVTALQAGGLDGDDERRLSAFGDLLALAITSIEDRARLATEASSDALTGLSNHRTLRERLGTELARGQRHNSPLSVAVIDVDNFKRINDAGGHEAGDKMLIWVAHCLAGLARSEDTLARVGGDEFAWVLPETTREEALLAVERARRAIADAELPMPQITVSAGICEATGAEDPAELIRCADQALYWSKQHGRDQVRLYDLTASANAV